MPSNTSVNMQTLTSTADRSRAHMRSVSALSVVLAMGLGMVGCQKTALRPDDDRSQFDRYDQSRSQRAEPFLEDEFGRRTPNLADRLLDRDR
tara:strand:- start:14740 stop:15015 length:276 start_codon:yes stop_codon:yes gene_type:complete